MVVKMAGKLTAAEIRNIVKEGKPGRYGDGDGLYLNIAKGGSASWIMRVYVDGKRVDKGIGSLKSTPVHTARKFRDVNRGMIAKGQNPWAEGNKAKELPTVQIRQTPTFREASIKVHELARPSWNSEKRARNWWQQMELHVNPKIGDALITDVSRLDVVDVLKPLKESKGETFRKARQSVQQVFTWAIAMGYREDNPADTKVLDILLPKVTHEVCHRRAVPYADVPATYERIRWSEARDATRLALMFTILTAARGEEARGATWDEMNLENEVWEIPASRMKAKRGHRVPLTIQAQMVLREAKELDAGNGVIFPSDNNRPLSENAFSNRAKVDYPGYDTHGFRSSFRDWARLVAQAEWDVCEYALAHTVGNAVAQAYQRDDLLEERRELMEAWANHLDPLPF
jgi:integrase